MNDDQRAELDRLRNRFDEELERRKIDALAEFAAGAGHEINNPLAIIAGHAQLLLREIENTEHRRQLAVIAAQVKRAYEMIADIRYFARPPKPEPETFDLVDELRILVEEQQPLMDDVGVKLYFEPGRELANGQDRNFFSRKTPATNGSGLTQRAEARSTPQPRWVKTDPVQLHLTIAILCNNARDALRDTGGNVRLRIDRVGGSLEISVEDDGPGVSDEIRPLIFCPYFSGRQAGRGLGFGLPKAWRVMQQLGGSIRYEKPESGRGARFVVSIPDLIEP